MSLLYADTSAIVSAYFADENDHERLSALLLEGDDVVVTSELARVEFASAVHAAARTARIDEPGAILARFDADCQEDGAITLLQLRPDADLPAARRMLVDHKLRTLDAIHLSVAVHVAWPLAAGVPFSLVTRDERQAEAGLALGVTVM